jgi:A/G-specific adenine glycosylase
MTATEFSKKIIFWYQQNKRDLPWRDTRDPYKIWLSEIILQQTRVAQGLPYYNRFIEKFPTVIYLAKASEQDVLRLWQGLGYYTRARNLHRCAKEVVEKMNGKFPDTYHDLLKLPGIGSYTAAAIASFSFREPVAVVDGNVFRVLARVFGIDKDIASPQGKVFFSAKANQLIPKNQPDLFNQAIMEFGAMHCVPKSPNCAECIFSKVCVANQGDLQLVLPVKNKKTKVRKRFFHYFLIEKDKKWLMKQRTEKDIWKGLFDFYLIESNRSQKAEKLIPADEVLKNFSPIETVGPLKHVLSHQHLHSFFTRLKPKTKKAFQVAEAQHNFKFYSVKKMSQLPKSILITRFLEEQGILD